MKILLALLVMIVACDSTGTTSPPPFATPPLCNGGTISSITNCNTLSDSTAVASDMFSANCYRCKDAVGHDIGYVAQPGDPAGTNDLSCWSDADMHAICVGVCVPATQDHRGCPP